MNTTKRKMSFEELVFILALASTKRCEFPTDYYLLMNELEKNGVLTITSADSAKHTVRFASKRSGVILTELGRIIHNDVVASLKKSEFIE